MKKSLFFVAAASALMLTACSSENDVVQSASELQQSAPKAVGFDVYTQNANEVTRGGYKGVMNTSRLQGIASGFGIFGYYTDQTDATARVYPHTTGDDATNDYIPNFMWNEQVTWNNTNKGWVYSPLKYWPNETENDSQTEKAIMDGTTSLLDQLTFFAYAPYVDPSATGFDDTEGIRAITANTGVLTAQNGGAQAKGDPAIEYKTSAKVEDAVDLLWGVAPAGGLNYTAVNGDNDGALEGMPYIDLVKPDVNTSLKFYFQHALARFGFTVAAAIDQVPQGGGPLDASTRITIKQVDLTGYFADEGILNLNNTEANVANWINFNGTALAAATALDGGALTKRTISITADIANDIEDSGSGSQSAKTGVTTAKQDLLVGRYSQIDVPAYVPSKKYYSDATGTVATATYTVTGSEGYFTYNSVSDVYTKQAAGSIDAPAVGSTVTGLYTLVATGTANNNGSCPSGLESTMFYTKDASDTYTKADIGSNLTWTGDGSTTYYAVAATPVPSTSIPFAYSAPIYDAERSYIMLIPTNNVKNICTTNFGNPIANAGNLEALRTVWVTITYYVTTDDTNLADGVSRVENKIQKKVVLPSLANGKSYNLNLLLGLTSVKVEAEVGDWSEEFIQADLPQNTPGQ